VYALTLSRCITVMSPFMILLCFRHITHCVSPICSNAVFCIYSHAETVHWSCVEIDPVVKLSRRVWQRHNRDQLCGIYRIRIICLIGVSVARDGNNISGDSDPVQRITTQQWIATLGLSATSVSHRLMKDVYSIRCQPRAVLYVGRWGGNYPLPNFGLPPNILVACL